MKNIKQYKAASLFLALCFGLGLVVQSMFKAYGSELDAQDEREKPKQTVQVSVLLEAVAPTVQVCPPSRSFIPEQMISVVPVRLSLFRMPEKWRGKFWKALFRHLKAANAP